MLKAMTNDPKKIILNDGLERGFTLIELLVVISIIAVLLAVLLPALSKAKTITKRLVCKSNLKNIGLGWHMFLDNNEEYFCQGINVNFTYGGWTGTNASLANVSRPLNQYLSLPEIPDSPTEAQVFRCPADKGDPEFFFPLPYYLVNGNSYYSNKLLIGQNLVGPGFPGGSDFQDKLDSKLENGIRRSKVDNPWKLVVVGDKGWWNQWLPSPVPRGVYWHGKDYHYNVVFLDGHVEFVHIRKGLLITEKYTILPFKSLYGLAQDFQVEEPNP